MKSHKGDSGAITSSGVMASSCTETGRMTSLANRFAAFFNAKSSPDKLKSRSKKSIVDLPYYWSDCSSDGAFSSVMYLAATASACLTTISGICS